MSAKLTPQEYGKAWFPVWKEKKIYGPSTLGILQRNIALSSRSFLIKDSLKGLPSRVSQFGEKIQTGVFDEGLSSRVPQFRKMKKGVFDPP